MTTFTQITQQIEAIAKKARENYEIFQRSSPKKGQDQKQLERIQSQLDVLKAFQDLTMRYKYAPLRKIVDPGKDDPDKDIEEFIASMPEETAAQRDQKIAANIALKQALMNIKVINKEVEAAIRYLGEKMEQLYTSEQYQLHQDTTRYAELVKAIRDVTLVQPPEHKKNKLLNIAYQQMKLAFEQMKGMGSDDEALRTGRKHQYAISLLEDNLQQYKKYEGEYKRIRLEQQQSERNIRKGTIEFEQLSTRLKEVLDKFSKTDSGITEARAYLKQLSKKKFDTNIERDVSYIDRNQLIYSNIMRENESIELLINQLEGQYQINLEQTQGAIEHSAALIGQTLTEVNKLLSLYSTYLPESLHKKLSTEHASIQSKNLGILQVSIQSQDRVATSLKVKKITDLVEEVKEWKKDVTVQIFKNITEHYKKLAEELTQRIEMLKGSMNQKHYSEYYSSLEDLHLPLIKAGVSIHSLVDLFGDLEKTRLRVNNIDTAYQGTKASVNLILDGLNKGQGIAFLQTYLSLGDLTSTAVAGILNKVAQQSSPMQVARALAQVKFSGLSLPVTQGIQDFMNTRLMQDAHLMRRIDVHSIGEKLTCYGLLQSLDDKDKHMPLIDDAVFRQALLFLERKGLPIQEAVSLTDTENKREIILAIKEHCNLVIDEHKAITGDEIKGILSSAVKIEAAAAIFKQMGGFEEQEDVPNFSADDQNAIYILLMREIASNEQFAQAVLQLKDNEQLFEPKFLLCLAKYKDTSVTYGPTKDFLIEQLNSKDSADYQTVLVHLLQVNKSSNVERAFHSFDNYVDIQMIYLYELQKNPIPIKKLAKVFDQVDELFASLISSANETHNDRLASKLALTKKQIFTTFMKSAQWEDGVNKSIEMIKSNFKDNRGVLQKILDGFIKIVEKISNWWNNVETPKPVESVDAKDISSRFKGEMDKIRSDDQSSEVNSSNPPL